MDFCVGANIVKVANGWDKNRKKSFKDNKEEEIPTLQESLIQFKEKEQRKKEEQRIKLYDILYRYFEIGDSDCYHLVRVKEAFAVGTVSLDDFVEFDEDTIEDLVSYIIREWGGNDGE